MKKLFIILLALLLSTASFSQKNFDNEFYFRFGYSLPSWNQFGIDDWGANWKRSGFSGEIGTIFMLNNALKSEKMALGIDVDYLAFYWNRFSNSDYTSSLDIGTLRFSSKAGPSFTISPVDRLAIDIFVKAEINWVTASAFVYDNNSDDSDAYGKVFALGIATGFNVRYSIVMIGFEFSTISPKLENIDNDGDYLGQANSSSDKTPLPSFNFTIGLSF